MAVDHRYVLQRNGFDIYHDSKGEWEEAGYGTNTRSVALNKCAKENAYWRRWSFRIWDTLTESVVVEDVPTGEVR